MVRLFDFAGGWLSSGTPSRRLGETSGATQSGGEDIRVRAIDALLPIGDTAVVNADPHCKLLLTQMAFFPIFSDPTTDLVFHTVTAFSSDTGKNGNSN